VQPLGSEVSCSSDSCSENIVVEPIIVPELELRNVKMQVLFADVVEGADDAALNDAPKALDRVRVNRADNVLPLRVVNSDVRIGLAEAMISDPERLRRSNPSFLSAAAMDCFATLAMTASDV
jgi:hypothetical protein